MAHCQITTITPNLLYNCSFLSNIYLSNAAVFDQFQFNNYTSIKLTANYAFISSSLLLSTFELGLIYQFSTTNYLVPFPVIFNCASIVHSCQLKTMKDTTMITHDSEPIRVQLTSFNYMSITRQVQFNQMGLYLKQGRYQLSNCSLNDGQQMTDPKTIFYIQIQYEKSIGSSCDSMNDICGSSSLTTCTSSTCTCHVSSSALVSYSDSFYCADMINSSNCKIFPSRCITWCNGTKNYLCICPIGTLKFQRNNIFVCELPINSNNCSINDNDIPRCSYEQCCINGKCIDCSMTSTTSKSIRTNDSLDERLRIAVGVIAGLLGTSIIILLITLCWLRQRQKRRRRTTKKSRTPSSNLSTSSLYISPNQRQDTFPSSLSTMYQLGYNDENKNKIFNRTDSFRQAVLSGNRKKQIIERVSTKRDSFTYEKDGWSSPTFSTLEFIIPSNNNNNNNNNQNQSFELDKQNNNIYHIIMPSNHTHAV
ncbi:unnamed protein product [Rotaria sordida]|uniref:Epidermal growth factor receptor-like transmembrane-juxtamembrane segment domain-containing protein n=1 Tax=Rotaria sordida TaxID=392033 RepID=A0A813XX70_9BILA|nr:unnamed protein product [Rotaria sordida]CAF3701675.1 unnamed protein product [Rotaria sordida]